MSLLIDNLSRLTGSETKVLVCLGAGINKTSDIIARCGISRKSAEKSFKSMKDRGLIIQEKRGIYSMQKKVTIQKQLGKKLSYNKTVISGSGYSTGCCDIPCLSPKSIQNKLPFTENNGYYLILYLINSLFLREEDIRDLKVIQKGGLNVPKKKDIEIDHGFEEFWEVFPRKTNKKEAFKNWKTRIKQGHKPAEMIVASKVYAKLKEEETIRYILHPATFLGPHDRYKDYLEGGSEYDSEPSGISSKKGICSDERRYDDDEIADAFKGRKEEEPDS